MIITKQELRLARNKLERIIVGIGEVSHRIPARTSTEQLIKTALQAQASALVIIAKAVLLLTELQLQTPEKSEEET